MLCNMAHVPSMSVTVPLLILVAPRVACGEPELIDNGMITASTKECVAFWDVGCIITYTCTEGYSLFGNQERECNEQGKWTGSKPTCASKCSTNS